MSSGGNNFVSLQAHVHGLASLINVREIPTLNDSYRWRMFQSINAQLVCVCRTFLGTRQRPDTTF